MTGALCTLAARSLAMSKGPRVPHGLGTTLRRTRLTVSPQRYASRRVIRSDLVIGFFPYHLQRGGEPLGDAPSITVRHGVPLDRLD
jgi:hypothetical protein